MGSGPCVRQIFVSTRPWVFRPVNPRPCAFDPHCRPIWRGVGRGRACCTALVSRYHPPRIIVVSGTPAAGLFRPMRIAKPILIVSTPIGVAWGLIEAHRLAGGLVFLMAMMVLFMGAAFALLIHTIRREKREAERAEAGTSSVAPADDDVQPRS